METKTETTAQATTEAAPTQQAATTAAAPAATTEAKDTKATASPEKTSVVPDKYDLKLPEGSKLSAARIDTIAQRARERGLSNELAQQLVQDEHEALATFEGQQAEAVKQQQQQWLNDSLNDSEIGGGSEGKRAEHVELAYRFFNKFGSKDLVDKLRATGLGNHPELIRLGVRAGKAMAEDKFVNPGAAATGAVKSDAEIFYPEMFQK